MSSVNKQLTWKAKVSDDANTWLQISTDKQQWFTTIDPVVGNTEVYTKVIPGDGSGTITFTCKNCEKEISKTVFVQRCPCEVDSVTIKWTEHDPRILPHCGEENRQIKLTGTSITSYTNCEQVEDENYTSSTYVSFNSNDTDSLKYLSFEHEFASFTIAQEAGPCLNGCTCEKAAKVIDDDIVFEAGNNSNNKRQFFQINNNDCIGDVDIRILEDSDNWFSVTNDNNTRYIYPKSNNDTDKNKTCTIKVTYGIQTDGDENTPCGTKMISVTHKCLAQYIITPNIESGTLSCDSEDRTVTFTAEVKNNNE